MIDYNGDKNNLIEIITFLSENYQYEFKIITGSRDTTGGYGWHCIYSITVYKSVKYCNKCLRNEGVDYSDTAHPLNNHSYSTKTEQVFYTSSIDCKKICKDLLDNYKIW